MRIGRAVGIPIDLHWSFLVLVGIFALQALVTEGALGLVSTLVFGFALFGSVILHELGHAMAARAYGIPTRSITLFPFGGVAAITDMPSDTRKELVIALAGPAVNLVLFAVGLAAWVVTGLAAFGIFAGLNLVMGVFNLIPAFPMDGGRVLRSVLAEGMGFVRASQLAVSIGRWFGWGFIAVGLFAGMWSLALVGGFVLLAAGAESRRLAALLHRGWRPPRPVGHEPERIAVSEPPYRPRWTVTPRS